MGASYANAPDNAATGASSFYTLVLLTLYLAAIIPILVTRLAKGNKNVTTMALAVSCAGSFVAFKRVHPAAVAWADAHGCAHRAAVRVLLRRVARVVVGCVRRLHRAGRGERRLLIRAPYRSRAALPYASGALQRTLLA